MGRDGHKELGMQFWSLGKGGREGPNVVGLHSQGIGERREGTMLGGEHGSASMVMEHMGVDREGHNEVGMRVWGIGRQGREGYREEGMRLRSIGKGNGGMGCYA